MSDEQNDWIVTRMRKLLASDFCPRCGKHKALHDNETCNMRFVPDEEEVYA